MKIKIRRDRSEVLEVLSEYFNNYSISNSSIDIYQGKIKIATIDLNTLIMDADVRTINRLGSLSENLSICRRLDIVACV